MVSETIGEIHPTLGESIDEIETPALLVDLDTMERNIDEYVAFAREQSVDLRSHVKTHKNAEIAALQVDRSGSGIVCQTLGEVEIMARNGIDDIYLSYNVVGDRKLERLVWLSERLTAFATTVDHEDHVEALQAAAARRDAIVDVILEVDVGLARTGVEPGKPAVTLAEMIDAAPNLSFEGLLAYEAHVKSAAETSAEFAEYCDAAMDTVQSTVEGIETAGIEVAEVKVGGTATSRYSGTHPVVTEINPGMYPFLDVGELETRPFAVDRDDCAMTVVTTVMSKPSADRAVVDAGSKTLSMDKPQFPVPKHRDDVKYVNYSEEHGWLDISNAESTIEIGDRIEFIVPHVCTTINLHDRFIGHRDGAVDGIYPVQARGKVR